LRREIQTFGWNNEFLLLAGDTFGSEFFSEENMTRTLRFDSGKVGVNVAIISWGYIIVEWFYDATNTTPVLIGPAESD
jgi:hypothetical protein